MLVFLTSRFVQYFILFAGRKTLSPQQKEKVQRFLAKRRQANEEKRKAAKEKREKEQEEKESNEVEASGDKK